MKATVARLLLVWGPIGSILAAAVVFGLGYNPNFERYEIIVYLAAWPLFYLPTNTPVSVGMGVVLLFWYLVGCFIGYIVERYRLTR